MNFNFLLFISGYPTLTSIINCTLNQYFRKYERFNQTIAAIIGGFPFYFCANEMPILGHTLATAIEALWFRYKKYSKTDSHFHRFIQMIPFARLIYIIGGAYMYTSRLFYPWLAPKFLFRLVELLTNHKCVNAAYCYYLL